jgi:hypothetical protein
LICMCAVILIIIWVVDFGEESLSAAIVELHPMSHLVFYLLSECLEDLLEIAYFGVFNTIYVLY